MRKTQGSIPGFNLAILMEKAGWKDRQWEADFKLREGDL